jgi:AraC-like DNA-binding protein
MSFYTNSVAVISLFLCLFFAAFLYNNSRGNRSSHKALAALLLVLCCENLNFLLHSTALIQEFPFLANLFNNFGILLGTLLYFYTKLMIEPLWFRKTSITKHFLPFILLSLYNLLFYHTQDSETQLAILAGEESFWSNNILYVVLFGHGVILVYLIASFRALRENGIRLKQLFSNIEPYELSWLRNVLVIFLLIWFLRFCNIPLQLVDWGKWPVLIISIVYPLLILLAIASLIYSALSQHAVFSMSADMKEISNGVDLGHDGQQATVNKEQDLQKLENCMVNQKLWTQTGLTLAQFAEAAELPVIYLSQLLNNELKQNFFEYVNSFRSKDAANKIIMGEKTMLDAALESGFNSKTAFNRAFKKHFGLTPSQYKKVSDKN